MRGRRTRPAPVQRYAVGYVRVSTEEQTAEGVSLDAPTQRVTAHAQHVGRPLACVVRDEGISAKTLDWPKLEMILADVRAGKVSAVVVTKLDRLTRSVRARSHCDGRAVRPSTRRRS